MGNVSAEFDYKLMDEPTLLKLYGKPVMSFKDPVDEIAKIKFLLRRAFVSLRL